MRGAILGRVSSINPQALFLDKRNRVYTSSVVRLSGRNSYAWSSPRSLLHDSSLDDARVADLTELKRPSRRVGCEDRQMAKMTTRIADSVQQAALFDALIGSDTFLPRYGLAGS